MIHIIARVTLGALSLLIFLFIVIAVAHDMGLGILVSIGISGLIVATALGLAAALVWCIKNID